MSAVPVTWTEIKTVPDGKLRRLLAERLRAATAREEAARAEEQRRLTRENARRADAAYRQRVRETRGRWLGRENAAALATVTRCGWCGQWTCAVQYQRVPHHCERRAA